ncbi:MAG TPA: hypothetical protein VHE35_20360 [Kofleriaceae bacterium]|nr:hypothetical protein [Kofleriaceae bacterium]
MGPSDTHPLMAAKQLELLRAAGPARRAGLALRMSSSMVHASRVNLARLHPELDEEGVRLLWAELHDGKALTDRVRERLAARR